MAVPSRQEKLLDAIRRAMVRALERERFKEIPFSDNLRVVEHDVVDALTRYGFLE